MCQFFFGQFISVKNIIAFMSVCGQVNKVLLRLSPSTIFCLDFWMRVDACLVVLTNSYVVSPGSYDGAHMGRNYRNNPPEKDKTSKMF